MAEHRESDAHERGQPPAHGIRGEGETDLPDASPKRRKRPMIEATRGVTLRDFAIFQLKLLLDGVKDVVLFQVAIVAIVLDFLSGSGKRPRIFYSVLRHSERFDLWLNLNGALEELEHGDLGDDGLFGASKAGADTLLGKLEQLARGGDEPRGKRGKKE